MGFRQGSEAFALAHRKWEDFRVINPYAEYTEAVETALNDALKLQPGQPAPEFTLNDLDGQPVSLSQFRGEVVLLDFWARWCGPCIGDLPYLRKIKEKTDDQPVGRRCWKGLPTAHRVEPNRSDRSWPEEKRPVPGHGLADTGRLAVSLPDAAR